MILNWILFAIFAASIIAILGIMVSKSKTYNKPSYPYQIKIKKRNSNKVKNLLKNKLNKIKQVLKNLQNKK